MYSRIQYLLLLHQLWQTLNPASPVSNLSTLSLPLPLSSTQMQTSIVSSSLQPKVKSWVENSAHCFPYPSGRPAWMPKKGSSWHDGILPALPRACSVKFSSPASLQESGSQHQLKALAPVSDAVFRAPKRSSRLVSKLAGLVAEAVPEPESSTTPNAFSTPAPSRGAWQPRFCHIASRLAGLAAEEAPEPDSSTAPDAFPTETPSHEAWQPSFSCGQAMVPQQSSACLWMPQDGTLTGLAEGWQFMSAQAELSPLHVTGGRAAPASEACHTCPQEQVRQLQRTADSKAI